MLYFNGYREKVKRQLEEARNSTENALLETLKEIQQVFGTAKKADYLTNSIDQTDFFSTFCFTFLNCSLYSLGVQPNFDLKTVEK